MAQINAKILPFCPFVRKAFLFLWKGEILLENKVSVISIIIEDTAYAEKVNTLLHEYGKYIIGRMGIPYRERNVSIICIVMDAPVGVTSALSGKLGMLSGVSTKTVTTKVN